MTNDLFSMLHEMNRYRQQIIETGRIELVDTPWSFVSVLVFHDSGRLRHIYLGLDYESLKAAQETIQQWRQEALCYREEVVEMI